jgi:hypothetical protein
MRNYIIPGLTVITFILSCNDVKTSESGENITNADSTKQEQNPDKSLKESVFTLIFNNYDSSSKSSKIKSHEIDSIFQKQNEEYIERIMRVDTLAPNRLIVVTYIAPDDYMCNDCPPLLKSYEIEAGNKFTLKKKYYLGQYGNFGKPCPLKIKNIGKKEIAYFLEDGFTAEGITSENLYILKETGMKIKKVLQLENSGMNNSGACDDVKKPCYSFRSDYYLDTLMSDTNYYDLIIHKKGTELNPANKITKVDSLMKYRFEQEAYVPIRK